ncbi:MAG: hypothetical protein ACPG5B_06295 [Chitinophagales bacterium]
MNTNIQTTTLSVKDFIGKDYQKLPKIIYTYRWQTPVATDVINQVIDILKDFGITKLYSKQKKGVALFGRLLANFNKAEITAEQQKEVFELAKQMVECIDCESENLADLSLFAHNLYYVDSALYRTLTEKILDSVELNSYLNIPFDRGFLPLLKQITTNLQDIDVTNVKAAIFKMPFEEIITQYSLLDLNRIMWEMLQIDFEAFINYAKTVSDEIWLQKIAEEQNKDAIFRLLFILNHTENETLVRSLSDYVYKKSFNNKPTKLYMSDVPLIGFLMHKYDYPFKVTLPNLYFLSASIVRTSYTLSHIAYTVFFIRKNFQKSLFKFREFLSQIAHYQMPAYSWQNLLDNYPLEKSKGELLQIVEHFDLTEEPKFTFSQIEKHLLYSDVALSDLSFEKALGMFFGKADSKHLFYDQEIAISYLRYYFEKIGWEVK